MSNVDLPLNEVLGAVVQATGAVLVDEMSTDIPSTMSIDQVSVFTEGETVAKTQHCKDLQGSAYESLCKFMREAEAPPSRRWLGCPPCQSSPPADSWKTRMVQERNRNGGWAWVLKENRDAYVGDNREAAPANSARAPTS